MGHKIYRIKISPTSTGSEKGKNFLQVKISGYMVFTMYIMHTYMCMYKYMYM